MSKAKWQMPGTESTPAGPLKALGLGSEIPLTRLTAVDPAVSERQRRFMGAELARKRIGKKTKTGMSEEELRDYAQRKR